MRRWLRNERGEPEGRPLIAAGVVAYARIAAVGRLYVGGGGTGLRHARLSTSGPLNSCEVAHTSISQSSLACRDGGSGRDTARVLEERQ